jgi:hypothetical protein
MPLLGLWKSDPATVDSFTVEQVVSFAGDGRLRDNSLCSSEFRSYISSISSEKLFEYVDHCLTHAFANNGSVLQDLVNELGRRLDYNVENGLYSGRSGSIGNDGLWRSPEGDEIVVEVKTTDAYRIAIDTIAGYRRKLIEAEKLSLQSSSILIVVGRQDTGELEAQVRGSRHAWDVRLISVEALTKLVSLKEGADEPETSRKIRSVLFPVEYTRVDYLVDVMFTTATDVETAPADAVAEPVTNVEEPVRSQAAPRTVDMTDARLLQAKREHIVRTLSARMGASLIKKSRATYWDAEHRNRMACTLSKRYEARIPYWYAYHPSWNDFLRDAEQGNFVLGCMDQDFVFSIPVSDMQPILPNLHTTETKKHMYWHIHLLQPEDGRFELIVPGRNNVDLMKYRVDLLASLKP